MNRRIRWLLVMVLIWLLDRPRFPDSFSEDGTKLGWLAGRVDVVTQVVAEKMIHWFVDAGRAFCG